MDVDRFFRLAEIVKYFLIGSLMAGMLTAFVVFSSRYGVFGPSFKAVVISGYVVSIITLFHRPVMGSIERSVLIARVSIAVLGLGSITGAVLAFLDVDPHAGTVVGTLFLILGGLLLYVTNSDLIWNRYRNSCQRAVEKYEEVKENSSKDYKEN